MHADASDRWAVTDLGHGSLGNAADVEPTTDPAGRQGDAVTVRRSRPPTRTTDGVAP